MVLLLAPILGLIGLFLWVIFTAIPFMWAWDYVMPVMFHMPTITLYQSIALIFVAKCLLSGISASAK